ncbi:MAG: tetratricopeptide repeat protein, partial [Blastocatellia bacterium]
MSFKGAQYWVAFLSAFLLFGVLQVGPSAAFGQSENGQQADRKRAMQLVNDAQLREALPILEQLAKDTPGDAEVQFYLGYARIWNAKLAPDAAGRKKMRADGYASLKKAKELGMNTPLLQSLLAQLPEDGGDYPVYSKNQEANEAMVEAEAEFARGDLDKALAAYSKALTIEPTLYEAALFAGDACFKSGDQTRAIEFYSKAVTINPERETGYRYLGDALMKDGKTIEARDKYIEGYITEPYTRLATVGLVSWAKKNNVRLAHPLIEIPTSVSFDDKNTNITLDPKALDSKDDGSSAWMMYGITRALWHNEKFAKQFPDEKVYRHSLAEESDALSLVALSASEEIKGKKAEQLTPSLTNLVKLKEAGLLEAYI